jgi:hypothetical protein
MSRRDTLLHAVYQALGANRVHQRWILPYRENRALVSVEGLADAEGIITISPLPLVPAIIHECLHREGRSSAWSELAIEQATTYLYHRMADDECRALYDAYARKVKIMRSPTESE